MVTLKLDVLKLVSLLRVRERSHAHTRTHAYRNTFIYEILLMIIGGGAEKLRTDPESNFFKKQINM